MDPPLPNTMPPRVPKSSPIQHSTHLIITIPLHHLRPRHRVTKPRRTHEDEVADTTTEHKGIRKERAVRRPDIARTSLSLELLSPCCPSPRSPDACRPTQSVSAAQGHLTDGRALKSMWHPRPVLIRDWRRTGTGLAPPILALSVSPL